MRRNRLLRVAARLMAIGAFVIALLSAPTARAAVVENIETPESGTVFNFCTNNFDSFTGILHTIATETFAGDGSVNFSFHVDNHDVKLTDPILGDCEGEDSQDIAISTPPGVSTTQTLNVSLRVECSGRGDNQDATFAVPITLNPDGSVVVGSITVSFVCR